MDMAHAEIRTVLLGFRRLRGPHSGENQAALFWDIVQEMDITRRLGFFTLDNATSNDSALEFIAQRSREIGIPFEPQQRRIRCLGHVLNLTVKALIWGKHSASIEQHLLAETQPEEEVQTIQHWRKYGPLGKLYNCIRYVLKTLQRRERFEERCHHYVKDGQPVTLVLGNDTRWNGDMAAIARALSLREPLEDFISAALRTDKDCTLAEDELNPDEWQQIRSLLEILQPFKKWTLILQQKDHSASIADVIPAYDELLSHLEEQKEYYTCDMDSASPLITAITAAWAKLNK
jgi:hypothetical protein